MLIEVHLSRVPVSAALKPQIEERLNVALQRFQERVGRVSVSLTDCNGPRGGVDKQCRIVAAVRPFGQLVVEGRGENIPAAFETTSNRLKQVVRRLIGKRRTRRRTEPLNHSD